MSNQIENNFNEEDQIDIIALLKTLWNGKKLIVKTTILFFIIGCVVALLSPVVYTAQTTFIPQVSEDQMSSSKGGLGSLASLAGINLNQGSSTSDSYLSPLLYSKIANSDEFSLKLIEEELINLNGDKFSIKQYMLSDTNSSFNLIGFIKKYTIGLFIKNDNELKSKEIVNGYNFISQEEFDLLQELSRNEARISIFHNYENIIDIDSKGEEELIQRFQQRFQTGVDLELDFNSEKANSVEDYIEKINPDLVVVRKENKGFFEDLFTTSVSKTLSYHIKVPMLVLRQPT